MRANLITGVMATLTALPFAVKAEVMADHAMHDVDGFGPVYHMIRLEADTGAGPHGAVSSWDLDGWIGGDTHKLWLKSEGTQGKSKLEDAEAWMMYSRNVATFWDAQVGLRHDEPDSATYAVLGVNGLAPYYFETEAHLFVSDKGKVSARLREENDLLLTQKLILKPYAELNVQAQPDRARHTGAGLTDGKVGLQTRYEFTRAFAPYVDIHYGRKFGETSSMAQSQGDDVTETIGTVGLRLMF